MTNRPRLRLMWLRVGRSLRFLIGGCALVCAVARPLHAAEPSPQEVAAAEALFAEGKRLMTEKRYPEACPKLAESQRLDPGGGTLLALALCHEADGKTASAWVSFNDALTVALKDGNQDRVSVAREHLAELEPRLARVVIRVPAGLAATDGLEIVQDGVLLRRAAWGTPLPVDPGEHHILVRAPGKRPFETRLVSNEGQLQGLDVPMLESEPVSKPTSPTSVVTQPKPDKPVRKPSSVARTSAYVLGGVGVLALGAGAYFGLSAISDRKEAKDLCPNKNCDDPEGVELNDDAGKKADLSTVAFGVGGAAIGAAIVLYIYSQPSTASNARSMSTAPRFDASITNERATLTFSGKF